MRSPVPILVSCLTLLVAAASGLSFSICGTNPPPERFQGTHRELASLSKRFESGNTANPRVNKTVDTYIHVVEVPGYSINNLSEDRVNLQIKVLNQGFENTGFQFKPREPPLSINDENVGGWARYPEEIIEQGEDMWPALDGVVVAAYSVPHHESLSGLNDKRWSLGRTTIHEVGHWLGLMHPFDNGGCSGENDRVNDTAPCMGPGEYDLYTCDENRRSCGNQSEPDPVHNYMYYSSDECGVEFTPGQIHRMHREWDKFRVPAVPGTLKPIEPVHFASKPLPYYPPPSDSPLRVSMLCEPDEDGYVAELREEYCGSNSFCHRALWKWGAGGKNYTDIGECLAERMKMSDE
ncbi:pregnancy-associated plasma protein-A domain-containing protein [Hirsutella rhossiliensis]|uniref:Pregnancy-associated plasma protein-A domain-containing protein n=1 Tax=Hirsutella rhossiliensis TaxID=111463 RepID=A0A9P8SMQ8_9HYPO|nr:pregnancy-associated plasma protein-A domain-containing protein [Hirsutella rhossiliensis]KAH0968266.1 pregnancy-associated plasma protein-A domain-containing protein [Hirsutella rhossiliensis]